MANSFCKFPQSRFWHELRDHLLKLPGAAIGQCVDDPVIGSWIDFTFQGHLFTVNTQAGEFLFFADGTGCPDSVLAEIAMHCKSFFDDSGEIALRRV